MAMKAPVRLSENWKYLKHLVKTKRVTMLHDSVASVAMKKREKLRANREAGIEDDVDDVDSDSGDEGTKLKRAAVANFNVRRKLDDETEILWVSSPPTPRHAEAPLQMYAFHTAEMTGHKSPILLMTQNLNFVVTCSKDETCVWWKQRWMLVHRLESPRVYSACMSTNMLFLRDAQFNITVWNPAIGRLLYKQAVSGDRAPFGVTDKLMLVAAHTCDIMEVFNVQAGSMSWVCMMENEAHKGKIETMSCAGRYCVTAIQNAGFFLWCVDIDYQRFAQCVRQFPCPGRARIPCSVGISESLDGSFIGSFFDGTLLVAPEHHEPREFGSADKLPPPGEAFTMKIEHDVDLGVVGSSMAGISRDGRFAMAVVDGMGVVTYDLRHRCVLHILKDNELATGLGILYTRKGTVNGYQIVCATRNKALSVWTIEAVDRVRSTFLMSFHERAGQGSIVHTAWVQQGQPLYTKAIGSKLLALIFAMGTPTPEPGQVQTVCAEAKNANNEFDADAFALHIDDNELCGTDPTVEIGEPLVPFPPGVHSMADAATDSATSWMKHRDSH
ncbi:Uncharacterized protein PBTT_00653 [Plasmodiophora brassicae]